MQAATWAIARQVSPCREVSRAREGSAVLSQRPICGLADTFTRGVRFVLLGGGPLAALGRRETAARRGGTTDLFAAGRGLRVGPVAGQLTVGIETSAARGLWSSIPASANPQSSSESAAWIVSWLSVSGSEADSAGLVTGCRCSVEPRRWRLTLRDWVVEVARTIGRSRFVPAGRKNEALSRCAPGEGRMPCSHRRHGDPVHRKSGRAVMLRHLEQSWTWTS